MSEGLCTPLAVDVQKRVVHRLLGYPRAQDPSPPVEQTLSALWSTATALLEPRGVFRFVPAQEAAPARIPRATAVVAVGLCTIGPALEAAVSERADRGENLEALLLDTIGSAAAEAAADALNGLICAAARQRGCSARARMSPGYGRWEVSNQAALLRLLPAESLGVSLTAGMMMVPRKSVSFAARIARGSIPEARAPRCRRCGLRNCAYRVDDEAGY